MINWKELFDKTYWVVYPYAPDTGFTWQANALFRKNATQSWPVMRSTEVIQFRLDAVPTKRVTFKDVALFIFSAPDNLAQLGLRSPLIESAIKAGLDVYYFDPTIHSDILRREANTEAVMSNELKNELENRGFNVD